MPLNVSGVGVPPQFAPLKLGVTVVDFAPVLPLAGLKVAVSLVELPPFTVMLLVVETENTALLPRARLTFEAG